MSTDEYVPSLESLLDHYEELSLTVSGSPEIAKDNRRIADRSLARVRRDAAREAIDGLIADKAHMTVLLHAENGGNVEDVLTHYRDTLHPEETP